MVAIDDNYEKNLQKVFKKEYKNEKKIDNPIKCEKCNYLQTGVVKGFCCKSCKSGKEHGQACLKIEHDDKDW